MKKTILLSLVGLLGLAANTALSLAVGPPACQNGPGGYSKCTVQAPDRSWWCAYYYYGTEIGRSNGPCIWTT